MNLDSNQYRRGRLRWRGYDYSRAGAYFITIVCGDRSTRFGQIIPANDNSDSIQKMELNEFGLIAFKEWDSLPNRFPWLSLDEFQIMPNHMHGIVILEDCDELNAAKKSIKSKSQLLSRAMGAYKSLVFGGCIDIANEYGITLGRLWQRSFYDHVIRNERSYERIARYIRNNPNRWTLDRFRNR